METTDSNAIQNSTLPPNDTEPDVPGILVWTILLQGPFPFLGSNANLPAFSHLATRDLKTDLSEQLSWVVLQALPSA